MFLLSRFAETRAFDCSARRINAAKNYQNDATAFTGLFYDTIKAAIFVPAKRMFIGWRKSPTTLSINAWRRASLSRANTAATWLIAHSAVHRFHGPFTRATDGAATVVRLLPGAMSPSRLWHGADVSIHRDAGPGDRQ